MPKVSVIIPNYNHARFLRQRIDSVLNQTFRDFEVIILDDCSTDNSRNIIESYRENKKITHIIYNERNSGSPFKQWQKGIEMAEGEYVWIAESDDWCEADFLSEVVSLLKSDEHIGIAFCNSHWVDENGKEGKSLSIYDKSFIRSGVEEMKRLLRYNTIQNASAVVMKTKLALNNIKFASRFKSCGDWMLYINILSESKVAYSEKKMNYFRWYHNNVSNASSESGLWFAEGLKIIRKSKGYKAGLSSGAIWALYQFWKKKTNKLSLKSRFLLLNTFSFYFLRTVRFKVIYW